MNSLPSADEQQTITSEYRPLFNRGTQMGNYQINANHCGDNGESLKPQNNGVHKRWPWFIWFLLKFIGLYNCRSVVTKRRCHQCRVVALRRRLEHRELSKGISGHFYGALDLDEWASNEEDALNLTCVMVDANLNEMNDDSETMDDACVVCQTEWWDAHGRSQPYSETDIGVHKWNHRGSTILSVIWPLILIAFIIYDSICYLRNYWGREKDIIRLISYSTFLFFSMLTPVLSLMANVHNIIMDHRGTGWHRGFSWYNALGMRYIVKRLQHLELAEKGLPHKAFLAVCLIWPCFNGVYRVVIYYGIVKSDQLNHVHINISLLVGMASLMVFGAFCYLMLLLRLSFQKQQRLELAFLQRHAGALDVCRRQLAIYAGELGSMVRLVSIWILFDFTVSTWAFTTQICWNYLMMAPDLMISNVEYNIDVLIWSENIMFLTLPLVAVGGIDLNRLWVQFKRRVSQMRCEAQEYFWDKILAFFEEQSPVTKVETLTLVFSALGLFLALKFTDQNVEYWNKLTNNTLTESL